MSPHFGSPWGGGPAGRRTATPNPNLRVSDAQRSEVADQLSRHYADGRLDEAEFNERVGRAMGARTEADLSGLLDDLPPAGPAAPPATAGAGRPRRPFHPILMLVLLAVLATAVWHALWHPFFFLPFFVPLPWLLAGLILFLWLRRRRRYPHGGGRV